MRPSLYFNTHQGRFMNKLITLLPLLFISSPTFSASNFEPSKFNCSAIEKRIKNINSKMRAGYSAREGERLREELRTLKDHRYACKKKQFSTK
jgi:hypothetical protein